MLDVLALHGWTSIWLHDLLGCCGRRCELKKRPTFLSARSSSEWFCAWVEEGADGVLVFKTSSDWVTLWVEGETEVLVYKIFIRVTVSWRRGRGFGLQDLHQSSQSNTVLKKRLKFCSTIKIFIRITLWVEEEAYVLFYEIFIRVTLWAEEEADV